MQQTDAWAPDTRADNVFPWGENIDHRAIIGKLPAHIRNIARSHSDCGGRTGGADRRSIGIVIPGNNL